MAVQYLNLLGIGDEITCLALAASSPGGYHHTDTEARH
jgi:hypothetical protein